MRISNSMLEFWQEASDVEISKPLPDELSYLVERGWQLGPAGALLLAGCYADGAGWRSDWQAEKISQHEFEVNDVSVPCGDFSRERGEFLHDAVARSRLFASVMLGAARHLREFELLVAVISVGLDDDYLMHGATVKFATTRGGFPGVYEDLERFQFEAIAVVEALAIAR